MSRVMSGGLYLALLVGMVASIPGSVGAQEPAESPSPESPSKEEPPPEKPENDESDATGETAEEGESEDTDVKDEAPSDDASEGGEDGIITEDVDGKDWITPDVGAAQEEQEEDDIGDVDEVIIEYGASPDMGPDSVKDEEGKEVPDVAAPVVSKSVEVQDPDKLEPGADKETGVQGQVVSRRPKKVLPDAPVLAKGDDGKLRSTITDKRGRYRLYLPPGKYTLRSYYDLYHGARWDNINVPRGKFKRVNFILDPITEKDAGVEEQEIVYLADTSSEEAQLNIRKEAVGVQDAISAEEIKRSGDGSTTGAISRVVGVTIDDDDRIIIRGLADRYNTILLNEMPVPGVDPDVPSVKLDIFPTDIVSNLAVVKAPRPDLPGNFAGGLLMIETSSYPAEQMIKAGVSIGGNSLSTFRQMPTYQGGRRDWIGFDDGTRALPASLGPQRLDVGGRAGDRYRTNDQVSQVGRDFSDVWNPSNKLAIPQLGLKVSAGNSADLKKAGRRAGYLVSFLYEYEEAIETGFNKRFTYNADGSARNLLDDFDYQQGKQEVLWGTFGSGFLELDPDNFLNFTTMFSRTSDDTTILQLGGAFDNDFLPQTKNSYNFIGRTIFFNQLTGDHRNIKDSQARLRWNAVVSTGRRDEPDRRQIRQTVETQTINSATRYFSDLKQLSLGGKTSVRFPVYRAFDSTAYAMVGFDGGYTDRDFDARRFTLQGRGGAPISGDPEVILGPGLGPVSTIREITTELDSYTASNTLVGGFAQLETPMAPWLKFVGLLRFEAFRQQVASKDLLDSGDEPPQGTDRTDLDPLPSANFSFQINDKMFVKLGYGMTVIRPAIRELAPFDYLDFLRGWLVSGNENLQRTRVQNAEARYEYYFGKTDLISATAFGKYFVNPIEFVITNQTNGTASFQNADTAWLVGGEVELRLGFGRFTEKLEKFYFLGNVAVMGSQTTLSQEAGMSGRLQRRLFNQSPFVTNLSLRFDDPDSGVMVGLVYNAFGPRIVEAGSAQSATVIAPDVFEQTQHLLDLIATWRVSDHVKLGFKWKNIALARQRYKQGNEFTFLEKRGADVSISAKYIY